MLGIDVKNGLSLSARGIFLLHDLGSGSLLDTAAYGAPSEPRLQDSLEAGVDLVIDGVDSPGHVVIEANEQPGLANHEPRPTAARFVDMLFKEMRKSAPPSSLTGKTSNAEQTFGEMLDTKRAEELSKSGALGIGRVLEQQLRAAVIGEVPAAPAVRPRPESEQ